MEITYNEILVELVKKGMPANEVKKVFTQFDEFFHRLYYGIITKKDLELLERKYCPDRLLVKLRKAVPLVIRAEKIGMKPKKNNIPGKYRIGYKLARKMKSQYRKFFIEFCHLKAEDSRKDFHNLFEIDWSNPYILTW
jgi:hypothetical protein